jgi:hypothetical protein
MCRRWVSKPSGALPRWSSVRPSGGDTETVETGQNGLHSVSVRYVGAMEAIVVVSEVCHRYPGPDDPKRCGRTIRRAGCWHGHLDDSGKVRIELHSSPGWERQGSLVACDPVRPNPIGSFVLVARCSTKCFAEDLNIRRACSGRGTNRRRGARRGTNRRRGARRGTNRRRGARRGSGLLLLRRGNRPFRSRGLGDAPTSGERNQEEESERRSHVRQFARRVPCAGATILGIFAPSFRTTSRTVAQLAHRKSWLVVSAWFDTPNRYGASEKTPRSPHRGIVAVGVRNGAFLWRCSFQGQKSHVLRSASEMKQWHVLPYGLVRFGGTVVVQTWVGKLDAFAWFLQTARTSPSRPWAELFLNGRLGSMF